MPNISDLLDSDMEGNNLIDEDSILSSEPDMVDVNADTESHTAAKKTKKRHRVTMSKPKARTAKSSPGAATKTAARKTASNKRKMLDDVQSARVIPESQQIDSSEVDEGMEVEAQTKTERKPGRKKAIKKTEANPDQDTADAMEVEQTPLVARSSFARSAASKTVPRVTKVSKVKNTKEVPKVITSSAEAETKESLDPVEEIDEIAVQQPPPKRARTESRTRQDQPYRRRAGSASDTERGDPNLRRKLGDVTRKFENIDMKYRNLKEVGISEANLNVEKLRKQCEATTEASNNFIASLKKELAQQVPVVQDARKMRKEIQAREEEIAVLRASQTELKVLQTELTASLTTAQNDIKALQAKLSAARATSASAEPAQMKAPGSAMKPARITGLVSSDTPQAAQLAQMKLDLYGDLTGLIVRSVKRTAEGDTYECIQTGRNGTLHFKLFIDQEDAKTASFQETEFLYTPLLDADRDRDMMELMPPYLTEDITFARQNAAKFYQRVVDTLTRRAHEV